MDTDWRKGLENFDFRSVPPPISLGTCSDRYAGWIGQIYSREKYEGRISSRTRTLGGKTFYEEVLPVDSVIEYFQHFPLLEIDFTFYRPLLDHDGKPTTNHRVLSAYRSRFQGEDRVVLKVPQAVIARKLRRGQSYIDNPDYLNPDFFVRAFYSPALEMLGSHLAGLIFEQEYQRKSDQEEPEALAEDLGRFFGEIPPDDRYHVEIRTGRLLTESLFDTLRSLGVGSVLSHWTWLPRLNEQFKKAKGEVLNSAGVQVVRLLTPRNVNYAKSYEQAFPFDRMTEGMLRDDMVEDTLEVIKGVIQQGKRLFILINNRFGGSAPLTGQILVERMRESGII